MKEYSREANEDLFRAYTWAREEEFAKVGLEQLRNPHAYELVTSEPQVQVRTPKREGLDWEYLKTQKS